MKTARIERSDCCVGRIGNGEKLKTGKNREGEAGVGVKRESPQAWRAAE